MGNCIYCGKKVGLLRKRHKACEKKNKKGVMLFTEKVIEACEGKIAIEKIENKLRGIQDTYLVTNEQVRPLLIKSWQSAVDKAFEDNLLSQEEESGLIKVSNKFGLTQNELDFNGAFTKVVKGGLLRDLMEGKVPDRIETGNLPFNLQKSEKVIWVFHNVKYFEQKTRRQYVGGSSGVSVRVAKGLYFRVGSFRGKTVESTETVHAGTGMLVITNKHLYFGGGSGKDFRIRLDKIVSFEPFSDGIGIQKEGVRAKPQMFETGDGWFTYNVVKNATLI